MLKMKPLVSGCTMEIRAYIVTLSLFALVATSTSFAQIVQESFSITTSPDDYSNNVNFDDEVHRATLLGNRGFSAEQFWQYGTANVRPRDFIDLDHELVVGATSPGGALIRGTGGGLARNSVRELAEQPAGSIFYMSGLVHVPTVNHININDRMAMGLIGEVDAATWDISTGLHLGVHRDDSGDVYPAVFAAGNTYVLGDPLSDGLFGADHLIVLRLELDAGPDGLAALDAWIAYAGQTHKTHMLALSGIDVGTTADLGTFVLQGLGGGDETTSPGVRFDEFRFGATSNAVIKPLPDLYKIYEPEITRGYMYPPGELLYNHDASIEYFQGRFYGAWNGNTNRWEGRPGQRNYWAWSQDGLNWSEAIVFDEVPEFGPPGWQTEWQPNLFNWNDEELWCFWTKAGGFIFSRLNEEKTGWDHWVVWEMIELKGQPYSTFPTQEPTVLEDGSVLIPSVFRLSSAVEPDIKKRTFYSGPIITRDGGETFYVPEDALVEHPAAEEGLKMWEPMYVVQDDGKIRMFNRTGGAGLDSTEMPDTALITALGSADGESMGEPYYSAIRTIQSRMWLGTNDARRIMFHHDSQHAMFTRDRINIAMFSSRTGRDDFVAGIPVEDEIQAIAYPQAVFVSNAAYVVYTHQNDPATIMVNKVDPLPSGDRWYVFPRSGNRSLTGNDAPRSRPGYYTWDDEEALESHEEISAEMIGAVLWLSLKEPIGGELFAWGDLSVRVDYAGEITVSVGLQDKIFSERLARDGRWIMLGVEYDTVSGETAVAVNGKPGESFNVGSTEVNSSPFRLGPGGAGLRLSRVEVYADTVIGEDGFAGLFNRRSWAYGLYSHAATGTLPAGEPVVFDAGETGGDFAGIESERLEPGYVEFFASARDVHHGPPNELGTNSVTITGWLSQKPKNDGVIFNALSADGLNGFSLRFNYNGRQFLKLGGEDFGTRISLPDPMQTAGKIYGEAWEYSPWFFFAVVLDQETGDVRYWQNGALSMVGNALEPGTDLSSGEVPGFGRPQSQLFARNHYPPYMRMHSVRVYDYALDLEEVHYDYHRFPGAPFSWGVTRSPEEPMWVLDVNHYDDRFACVAARRPLASGTEARRAELIFGGNSAAGVDLERFDPESDAVEVRLPVRMDRRPLSETVVLMTMGDDNEVALGLRRDDPDRVYVHVGGEWVPGCGFTYGETNMLLVRMDKDAVRVSNGEDTVSVPNDSISQRLYLGDGYPSFYIAPGDRFAVDISRFEARVGVEIEAVAGPNGSMNPQNPFVPKGGSKTISVEPDQWYEVEEVWVDGESMGAITSYTFTNVTVARTICVSFVEQRTMNTETPLWWLAQYGYTNDFENAALDNVDGTGMKNWEQYIAGTDPTDSNSVLRIENIQYEPNSAVRVHWIPVEGRRYSVFAITNLVTSGDLTPVVANLVYPQDSIAFSPDGDVLGFFRLGVELE